MKIEYKGKIFELTFDEYGFLDTVTKDGKVLSGKNINVQFFVNNQIHIFNKISVPGIKRILK